MKTEIALSVIIPVYNAEEHIDKLVTSFLDSKYKNVMEVICIDDGSSDRSLYKLHRLEEDLAFLHVFHQENSGVSAARNRGLAMSTGDYIFFVDADDSIRINELDTVFSKVVEHQNDIAFFGIEDHFLIEDGTCKIRKNYTTEKEYTAESFFKDFGYILNKHIMYSPCNKLYRHELLKKHRIQFKEGYAIGEDILFNLQCFYHIENVAMYENYVYIYYHDMKQATSGSSRYQSKEWDVFLETIEEIQNLLVAKQAFDENVIAYHTFIVRKLSASLNNVYAKNSSLNDTQKLNFIEKMYKTAIVQEALDDKAVVMEEKAQKLLHVLHKHHLKYAVHMMYKLRNLS